MEQQVVITKAAALKAHAEADDQGKNLLENLIGKKVLFDRVQDRIKTFKDVCADQGKNPKDYILPAGSDQEEIAAMALKKVRLIARALNEEWKADFSNHNQNKYYPWFKRSSSAGGFVCDDFDTWSTFTVVGPRLAFRSSELAVYAGQQFPEIYNEFLN